MLKYDGKIDGDIMKFNNFSDRNILRRRRLMSKQNKVPPMGGKKSLSRRFIEERANDITSQNIEAKFDRLAEAVLIDETTVTIIYHLKFARDARPATFNDDVIMGILDRIKDLQAKFTAGKITAKEQLEILKDMDAQIMDMIDSCYKTK